MVGSGALLAAAVVALSSQVAQSGHPCKEHAGREGECFWVDAEVQQDPASMEVTLVRGTRKMDSGGWPDWPHYFVPHDAFLPIILDCEHAAEALPWQLTHALRPDVTLVGRFRVCPLGPRVSGKPRACIEEAKDVFAIEPTLDGASLRPLPHAWRE